MGIIVFLGDSITDAGRRNTADQLGTGYVSIFSKNLSSSGQEWTIINKGVDGNVTEQVAQALHNDCISLRPDYVSILVGVNDIGMIAASVLSEQEKLYMLEDCIRSYHEMLFDLSRETFAKVITLEPFVFPLGEQYLEWLPWQKKMSKNIRKLAKNYGALFIPLQAPLEQKIQELGYSAVTTDGIHLTLEGQKFLAEIVKNSFLL